MDKLITTIELIEQLARQRENSNWRFRSYIKGELETSDKKLDAEVRDRSTRIAGQIDCTACANCCRTMQPVLDDADIDRLSTRLGITAKQFVDEYLITKNGERTINRRPCPFLKDSLCSVYEVRPTACRDFPYLQKPGFRQRMMGMVENYGTCPIVFNTMEELKRSTGFLAKVRRRRSR